MDAMLGASRDSFHHAIGASTLQREALEDRRQRAKARIEEIKAKQSAEAGE